MPYGYGSMITSAIKNKLTADEFVHVLNNFSANIDALEKDGSTALILAVKADLPEHVRVLLKCGADYKIANMESQTALSLAYLYSSESFDLIIERIKEDLTKNPDNSDLKESIRTLYEPTLKRSIQSGRIDPFEKILSLGLVEDKKALLFSLIESEYSWDLINSFFKELKEKKSAVSVLGAKNKDGFTPLVVALKLHNTSAVKALVSSGAHVNQVVKGKTPLMYAAETRLSDRFDFLLKNCAADTSIRDENGLTLFEHVAIKGYDYYFEQLIGNEVCSATTAEIINDMSPLTFYRVSKRSHKEAILLHSKMRLSFVLILLFTLNLSLLVIYAFGYDSFSIKTEQPRPTSSTAWKMPSMCFSQACDKVRSLFNVSKAV